MREYTIQAIIFKIALILEVIIVINRENDEKEEEKEFVIQFIL
jgi:hypothetical protein